MLCSQVKKTPKAKKNHKKQRGCRIPTNPGPKLTHGHWGSNQHFIVVYTRSGLSSTHIQRAAHAEPASASTIVYTGRLERQDTEDSHTRRRTAAVSSRLAVMITEQDSNDFPPVLEI